MTAPYNLGEGAFASGTYQGVVLVAIPLVLTLVAKHQLSADAAGAELTRA